MDKYSVKQLQQIAKERNLRGFWKLRKAELVNFINNSQMTRQVIPSTIPASIPTKRPIPAPRTKKQQPSTIPTSIPAKRSIPAPRTKKQQPSTNPTKRPIPAPRTKKQQSSNIPSNIPSDIPTDIPLKRLLRPSNPTPKMKKQQPSDIPTAAYLKQLLRSSNPAPKNQQPSTNPSTKASTKLSTKANYQSKNKQTRREKWETKNNEANRYDLPIQTQNEDKHFKERRVKRLKKKIRELDKKIKRNKHDKKQLQSRKKSLEDELNEIEPKKDYFIVIESVSALEKFAVQYTIVGNEGYDPKSFLKAVKSIVVDKLKENRNIRFKLILNCDMTRTDLSTGEGITTIAPFASKPLINLEASDVEELYKQSVDRMMENMAAFQNQGSNWIFDSIISFEIHTVKYAPLKGSSYLPLPSVLEKKKAIINIKNEKDNECFKWCILRHLHPVIKNPQRVSSLKKYVDELDMHGFDFPMKISDIGRFEKRNNIYVNVFGFEEGKVYPLRFSQNRDAVDLLLINDGDANSHYCLIKDFSRLVSMQVSKHHGRMFFCRNCMQHYDSEASLRKHEMYCLENASDSIIMPEIKKNKDGEEIIPTISFKNHNRREKVPFVVYADFEAFVEPLQSSENDPKKPFTNKYQKHKPCGFCYHIKSFDESIPSKTVHYRMESEGEDVSAVFVDMLEKDILQIHHEFDFSKPMVYTDINKADFENARSCWICKKNFKKDDKKVRDHCHFTGKYRGAAHDSCNRLYRKPKFTPIIFHNLTGYDSHLFIKNIGRSEGKINCIPNNEEKYISFSKTIVVDKYVDKDGKEKEIKHDLRFIDSFKFMATSLDNLVKNLSVDKLKETKKEFGSRKELVSRKGVYPYDYMDRIEKFAETRLPPKKAFYSKLNDMAISDEDYRHAQNVWKTFNMKTLGDYHDLYLKTDVLLLTDVFEEFRSVCLENYKLDPAWYYTAPGLAWDAALKESGVELELLRDYDMLLMVEKGIRGGVSMISGRYGKANNKYMQSYDESKPSRYIQYLDANNLYGWAMCKNLPVRDFVWMTEEELNMWKNIPCILEVDLEYPEELHDLHNDYPLAPERLVINKVEKLIPNLNNKKNYVIHHENLKQYLKLGLKLTKIHRGIKFVEEPWLKSYIMKNTALRSVAKNEFEKDFFKLMNNSVFGKTMENIRNRVDVRLLTNEKQAQKLTNKSNFRHLTIFNENLVAIHMKRIKLLFNKPVYCGMAILDISKTLMYDFHYNYILPKYGEKVKLLFTDTDSLAYEIETEDFYKDIACDVETKFDTSNFPKHHPSGISVGVNKKVIGMMKDEAGGKIIEEFVGLRAKLYSYKMYTGEEEKKCKGVKKSVVKRKITHQDYLNCLFEGTVKMSKMNVIRSRRHEMYTETVNKKALSREDDKRIIRKDRINTYAHGHRAANNR